MPPSPRGVLASVYYSALEAQGSNARFQPFLVAGIVVDQNEVRDWTRENPMSDRTTRRFEEDATSGIAWSVEIGASRQVTQSGRRQVIV
jgi:hypothetical protein